MDGRVTSAFTRVFRRAMPGHDGAACWGKFFDYTPTTLLTTYRVCARRLQPRSLRACSRDDPEYGARRGVLRRAACNRLPREARDPARQALRPGCEELAARIRKANARRCRTAGAEGDGSAALEPKIATVERREASVPRHGTQGASLGAWRAALCARPTGVPPSTRTSLGAPPTLFAGERSNDENPGADNAPRERDGLFEIVNCCSTRSSC